MIKHIGKHDQKKAVILFKEVPNEDHMCLIVYPDTLPRLYHDAVMKVLESAVGQNAKEVSDPLGRELMDDGRNVLQAMHKEGFIRKVPNNQVIITPNVNTTIRLDELNKILKEMEQGEEAKAKLAEHDAKLGMQTKAPAKSDLGQAADPTPVTITEDGVLTDAGIAQGNLTQATNMRADAERLLSEATLLEADAYTMAPELKPKRKRAPNKKTTAKKAVKKAAVKKARAKNVKTPVKN